MKPDRWAEIERIYHDALEHVPGKRAAFLEAACGGDDALKREVSSLLEHEEAAGAFLERPALEDEGKQSLPEPRLGERDIDGYEILSLLGAGGMGEVYRARDLTLGREVAIKALARSAAGAAGDLRRFEEEARFASALNHPNIVTIYGVGENDELAFIAMELVRGRTLREVLSGGRPPIRETLDLAVQLADALAVAHASGIVHRDLKPENLMVTPEGLLKVLDFGIAKLQGARDLGVLSATGGAARGVQTEGGRILGTIGYMSPEQAAGKPASHASDQFSFGAILYEMLAGGRAFKRNTQAATLDAILHEQPEPIEKLNAEVTEPLRNILGRCLAKSADERYADTRELVTQLRRTRDGLQRTAPMPTRRRVIWLAGAGAAIAVACLALWRLRTGNSGPRSLAVLPFRSAPGSESADYLCDGMTQGLIRRISGLTSLIVKPFSAALNFKGTGVEPRDAGRQLAADAVLTGTVMQKAGHLQVTAELLDVATGSRLWSDTYDRPGADALSIQDEIARAVVSDGIHLPLSGDDRRLFLRRPTEDPAAYDLYLRAIPLLEEGTESAYLEARELFQKALARDPNFALAYVALATTYSVMAVEGYEQPAKNLAEVSRNVRRALDCDQGLPDAHSEAAVAFFYLQWNWAAAEQEWARALQSKGGGIVPDFLVACALQRWALGRPEEALALARKARALDPLSPKLMISEADFLLQAGSLENAADGYEAVLRAGAALRESSRPVVVSNAWFGLAEVRRRQGRFDEAIDARRQGNEAAGDDTQSTLFATARGVEGYRQIERATARAQLEALQARVADGGYASPLDFARAYAQLEDRERAFAFLDAALADRSPGLVFLGVDRAWDPVREDPRFLAAKRRVGLPSPS